MGTRIEVVHLGLTPYRAAWQRQHDYHARCQGTGENILLLTEHLPVVTVGYRRPREQLLSVARLEQEGIPVIEVERGGGVTYHGPGQLVAYPLFSSLFRACGVKNFIARLETIMCRVSGQFGLHATQRRGFPGVWVGEQKLGAVGIAIRRGVSLHGFALNVNVDLRPFSYILPCGIRDAGVTSLSRECGEMMMMRAVLEQTSRAFAEIFAVPVKENDYECSGVERALRERAVDYHQPTGAA
jgi:lipoyl(octanoyl) transferase